MLCRTRACGQWHGKHVRFRLPARAVAAHAAYGQLACPLINLPIYNKRDAAQRCIPLAKIVVAYVFSKRREDSLSSFRLRVCVR